MHYTVITWFALAFFLMGLNDANKVQQRNKKPKRAVPRIGCDDRALKVSHTEFIVRCPANCLETRRPVYGTDVFASVSSVCSAALHGGVITNVGGKVLVTKTAGKFNYKGSFSNGVRSLSLPRWRESFVVTGKAKKGVVYPSVLDYIPERDTAVKTVRVNEKTRPTATAQPATTTLKTSPAMSESIFSSVIKPYPTAHKVRNTGTHPQDHTVRRPAGPPLLSGVHRGHMSMQERKQQVTYRSSPALERNGWSPAAYLHPDRHAGPRPSSDGVYHVPDIEHRKNPTKILGSPAEYTDVWNDAAKHSDPGYSLQHHFLSRHPDPGFSGDPGCLVDLAFLMDGSWSIGRRRFQIQKSFLVKVAEAIGVGVVGPLMGIIQYGDSPVMEFSLKAYISSRELAAAINKLSHRGGASNVGKALAYANSLFTDANGNRGRASNVAVVLLDGWPTDKVEEASRQARESGINIFFLNIEGPDEEEKENVLEANFVDKAVCRTNSFFSLPVASWFELERAVQPLIKRVCDKDRLVCSKTCLNTNDIVFIVDGSSSVGSGNFHTVLQFVANITHGFEISDTDTRVGVVQYTYEQRLEFAFWQHNTKAEVLAAIEGISYWSGGTSTGAAITYAAEQLFSKSKPNKRKIMIVITDGRSYDDVRAPALAIRHSGVIAYSVGIAWAAQDELEDIATDPDKDHSFFVDEFDNLYKSVPKILHNICQEFNSQPRN